MILYFTDDVLFYLNYRKNYTKFLGSPFSFSLKILKNAK